MSDPAKSARASIPCHHPSLHVPVTQKRFVGIDCTAFTQIENYQSAAAAFGRRPDAIEIPAYYWNAGIVTENIKRSDDSRSRLTLANETTPDSEPAGEASPLQDAEAQMRRALGLYGARRPQAVAPPAAPRPGVALRETRVFVIGRAVSL
jgi:hypothetical protein